MHTFEVCSLEGGVFSVQCVIYSVQNSVKRVRCEMCHMQSRVDSVQGVCFIVQCAVCSVHNLVTNIECVQFSVWCAVCTIQWLMFSVPCSGPYCDCLRTLTAARLTHILHKAFNALYCTTQCCTT